MPPHPAQALILFIYLFLRPLCPSKQLVLIKQSCHRQELGNKKLKAGETRLGRARLSQCSVLTVCDLVLVKVFLSTSVVLWSSHIVLWSLGFLLWKMELVIVFLWLCSCAFGRSGAICQSLLSLFPGLQKLLASPAFHLPLSACL